MYIKTIKTSKKNNEKYFDPIWKVGGGKLMLIYPSDLRFYLNLSLNMYVFISIKKH